MLVYRGLTVGWIKMKLGHIVLDEDSAVPPLSVHACCGKTAGWIKMRLSREVGLGLGDLVLDGNPAPLPKKGAQWVPILGPCLLWPNGWMDHHASWYEGRPRPRPHFVRWGPSSPPTKRGTHPIFGLCLLWPNGRPSQLLLSTCMSSYTQLTRNFKRD